MSNARMIAGDGDARPCEVCRKADAVVIYRSSIDGVARPFCASCIDAEGDVGNGPFVVVVTIAVIVGVAAILVAVLGGCSSAAAPEWCQDCAVGGAR